MTHSLTAHLRSAVRRRFAPIARRDAALAQRGELLTELRQEVRDLRREIVAEKPASFYRQLQIYRKEVREITSEDIFRVTPAAQLPHKLRNYQLAQSHAVTTPEVLRVWRTYDEIDLSGIEGRVALKADKGSGGRGVQLLEVHDGAILDIPDRTPVSLEQVKGRFTDDLGKVARGPYFVEKFIESETAAIPEDIKIFTFDGAIGHILLRRVGALRDPKSVEYRYVSDQGEDMGRVMSVQPVSSDIPIPDNLSELVATARHLSRATGLAFCRVDLYNTPRGPVLGEITRAPGGKRIYDTSHDEFLGGLWLQSKARLAIDLANGRRPGASYGQFPYPYYYPVREGERRRFIPGEWSVTTSACKDCPPA